jgi:hypothetical protein
LSSFLFYFGGFFYILRAKKGCRVHKKWMINSMCILSKHLSFILIFSFISFDLTGSIFSWSDDKECTTQDKREIAASLKKMMGHSLDAAEKYFKRTFPLLCASILAITTVIQRGIKWGREKKISLAKRILNDFMKPTFLVAKKMREGLHKNYQKNKNSWCAALGISGVVLILFSLRAIRNKLLYWGIQLNNENLVRFSLACGAQLGRHRRGKTALHYAIDCGNQAAALMLLNYFNEVDIPDSKGRTPLICAAQRGYFDLVEVLGKRGANVDSQDNQGKTALIEAVYNNRPNTQSSLYGRIIVYLVRERNADIRRRMKSGDTAINIATNAGHKGVADYLRNELIRKIFNQNTETCPICLENPQSIGFNDCTVTPCCTNFVCYSHLKATVLETEKCPMCRKHLAVHNN